MAKSNPFWSIDSGGHFCLRNANEIDFFEPSTMNEKTNFEKEKERQTMRIESTYNKGLSIRFAIPIQTQSKPFFTYQNN